MDEGFREYRNEVRKFVEKYGLQLHIEINPFRWIIIPDKYPKQRILIYRDPYNYFLQPSLIWWDHYKLLIGSDLYTSETINEQKLIETGLDSNDASVIYNMITSADFPANCRIEITEK